MYLHLGNGAIVKKDDIVGVFDMDNTTISKQGRKFLTLAEQNKEVVYAADDLPKAYILTNNAKKNKVYISSISTSTLLKRFNSSKITIVE